MPKPHGFLLLMGGYRTKREKIKQFAELGNAKASSQREIHVIISSEAFAVLPFAVPQRPRL
jgi:hypothetical protein